MRAIKRILLILCLLCFGSAYGQPESIPAPAPDPLELKADWWLYFQDAKAKLPDRTQQFIEKLRTAARDLTPDNQRIANETIDKIQSVLQSYQQVVTTPAPKAESPRPIADTYTIDQVISIHNDILRQNVEMRANQVQQDDENREIKATNQYLTTLRSRYSSAETRSEQKFLTGLEIIFHNISLKVAEKNLQYLKATYITDKKMLKYLQDELSVAEQRLFSTPGEQRQLEEGVIRAEQRWQQAREELQRRGTESVTVVSGSLGREEEVLHQVAVTELRVVAIREALAYNAYILAYIKLNLSRVLNDPTQIDAAQLDTDIDRWEQELFQLDRKEQDWTKRTEQLLQQYSQILSLSAEDIKGLEMPIRRIVENTQNSLLQLQQLDNELDDSFFVIQLLDQRVTGLISTFTLYMWKSTEFGKKTFYAFGNWLNQSLFEISPERHVTFASIVRFFLVLLITVWVSRFTRRTLRTVARTRKGIRKSVIYRVSRLFQYVIFTVGLLVAFTTLGFDFGNFLIVLGALGVGLGFGLQSIFNNFISGIIILFESQLKVGDYVELEEEGLRGEIREINVRNTLIVTNDGTDVLIPNSQIVSNRIINWTLREPYRRVHVPFAVAYGTDKELVKQVVLEAAKSIPNTLIRPGVPEPRVYLSKFGENALEFELVVWVDEPSTRRQRNTRSAYLWAIDTTFKEHGIQIPFPQRDIHIIE